MVNRVEKADNINLVFPTKVPILMIVIIEMTPALGRCLISWVYLYRGFPLPRLLAHCWIVYRIKSDVKPGVVATGITKIISTTHINVLPRSQLSTNDERDTTKEN